MDSPISKFTTKAITSCPYYPRPKRGSKNNLLITIVYVVSVCNIIFSPFLKGFGYLDEFLVLILGGYAICNTSLIRLKEFRVVLGFLFFYLMYSFFWGTNINQAIVLDFFIFLKPFICFYTLYNLKATWTSRLRSALKKLFFALGIYCWCISPFIDTIYSNTAGFYPACTLSAISYLYFSKQEKKDWHIALILLIPGILSFRSKFYTALICFIYLVFFLKDKKLTMSLRSLIIVCLLAIISIYVSFEKFSGYFITGVDDGLARGILYHTAYQILGDFFPFGSGFGSFGNEAAARYYSPIYYKYNIDSIFGLSPLDYGTSNNFLTDTFYPILAEFGICGIGLYVWFWIRQWKTANKIFNSNYRITLFLIFFMTIQNIADATFTSALGVPVMMLLGMTYSTANNKKTTSI